MNRETITVADNPKSLSPMRIFRDSLFIEKLKGVLPFLAMAMLLIVLFWKVLFLGHVLVAADTLQFSLPWSHSSKNLEIQNWYPADSILQFYPWQLYFKEMISQGELPLWNPYSFSGHPLLANSQSGFFDPFNILFLFFNFTTAYNLVLMLQLYAAGIFMYLYLRTSLGIGRFGALMGGAWYMLNGVFIVWLEWQWMVGGALWLPLILLLLDRSLRTKRHLYAVLAGIPLAGSFLGGMVQQSLAMVLTVVLYASIRAFMQYRETKNFSSLWHPFPFVSTACGVGFCLAAIQLLPTLELLVQSQRDSHVTINLIEWVKTFPKNFLLSLLFLVDFVNPYWTGNVKSLDFRTFISWPTFHGNIAEYQGYLGILALVCAGIAVCFRRCRRTAMFLYMALLILFLSFATPINLFLYYRWFFGYAFAVAVLASLGADYLTSSEAARASLAKANAVLTRLLGALVILVAGGNLILFFWGQAVRNFGRAYFTAHSLRNYLQRTDNVDYIYGRLDALYQNYWITSSSMYLPPLILAAIIMIFTMYRRGLLSKGLLQVACFGVASVELLYFGITFIPLAEAREIFPPTGVTNFLRQNDGLHRVLPISEDGKGPGIMVPNTHMPYKIQSVSGYDSLFPRRYAELIRLNETGTIESLSQKFPQSVVVTKYNSNLFDMLNVKYLVVSPQNQITDAKFHKVYDGALSIYENERVLPRAFIVSKARVIEDKHALLTTLLSKEFNPRREVLLERTPAEGLSLSNGAGESSAEVITYSPNRVVAKVHLNGDAFLVLGDNYFPGWKAFINGIETKIYRANYTLRAVFLKRGQRNVEFIYDPYSFKLGKWISVFTVLLVSGSLTRMLYSKVMARLLMRKPVP